MRRPIFVSIILLLPAHAQDKAGEFVQKGKTQFLPENKPHVSKIANAIFETFAHTPP